MNTDTKSLEARIEYLRKLVKSFPPVTDQDYTFLGFIKKEGGRIIEICGQKKITEINSINHEIFEIERKLNLLPESTPGQYEFVP